MKKVLLMILLTVFAVSAKKPPITIKILGDGKPVANALVYGRFFVPDYDNCSNPLVEWGRTDSKGILVMSVKKNRAFYWELCKACKCKDNGYKSGFGGKYPKTGVELRVSAQGYRSAKEKSTYSGSESQYDGYDYKNIDITVFLDRL